MSTFPAFTVRAYPAFRPAREFRVFAGKSQASELEKLESADPAELARSGKHDFQVTPAEVNESRLDPPPALGSQRPVFGRWKLRLQGKKAITYQIESAESLESALALLPPHLGEKLKINIRKR